MSNRKKKFGISAVCVCLLFVLFTAVGMMTFPVRAFAAEGDAVPYDTLNFKQVASGEDFALALTYNGDLYAWSLKEKEKTEDGKYVQTGLAYPDIDTKADEGKTLGDQYPAVPIRIATGVEQIAATRKTAAYVKTEGNLRNIYTWGVDGKESGNDGLINSNILLRDLETDNSSYKEIDKANRLIPNIINYNFEDNRLGKTRTDHTLTLTASEYNYALYAEPQSGNGMNYIWGQNIYNLLSTSDYPFNGTSIMDATDNATAVTTPIYLGTSTMFYYSESALHVKGRNYTGYPAAQDGSGMTGNIYVTGGDDGYAHGNDVTNITIPTVYVNWTAISSADAPKENNKVTLYTADGNAAKVNGSDSELQIDRAPVSAGYGFAFLLKGDGTVQAYGKNAPTVSGTYVQVVAGRQLSGAPVFEGYGSTDAYNNTAKWKEDGTLEDAYKDGDVYLSATLTATGEVTVFGKNGSNNVNTTLDTQALQEYGIAVDANAANKVTALFPGYGNNLFMLTSLGKIVHATADGANVQCKLMDTFADESGDVIENWTLDNGVGITFDSGYFDRAAKTGEEVKSTVTVGMRSLVENKINRGENNDSTHTTLTQYKDEERGVIATDPAGDTYRMLLPANTGNAVNVTGTADEGSWVGTYNQVRFYWKNDKSRTPIDQNVVSRYLTVAFTYHAAEGENAPYIDFTVTPVRSTQDKTIIMEYGIGRFDSKSNFAVSAESAAPYFYDCKYAALEITVQNTDATPHFETATIQGEGADRVLVDNGTIPVLDPNNPHNRQYSIAVNNVSAGLSDVLATLKGDLAYTESDFYAAIDAADKGFPAETKREKGSLAYYGQEKYYDNTYRYFVDDHDGDIYTFGNISGNRDRAYFTHASQPVDVILSFPDDKSEQLTRLFLGTDTQDAFVSPEFDNKYGLTFAVRYDESKRATILTVSYRVLLLTATRGMTDYLTYEGGDVSKPVKSFDDSTSYTRNNILQLRLESPGAASVHFNNDESLRSVQVFTRSSLTLKGENDVDYVSAADGKNHVYEYDPIVLGLTGGKTRTIDLAKLFADERVPAIAVTHDGKVDWDALHGTFDEQASALGFAMKSATSFELTALRVPQTESEFTVQLRRFEDSNTSIALVHGEEAAEIVTVHFTVRVDFDKAVSLRERASGKLPAPDVNDKDVHFVLSGNRMEPTIQSIYAYIDIVAGTNDPSVLTVTPENSTGTLILHPVSCGKAMVRYTVSAFGETFTDSFEVNVTKILQLKNPENVSSTKRVSIGKLKGELLKQIGESANNESLDSVLDENGKAVYTLQEYKTKDGVEGWHDVQRNEILFLKDVYVSNDAYIGIEVQAIDGDPQTVRIVVPFKRGNITYDVAFLIEPSAQTAKDGNGNALTMKINKSDKKIEILNVDNGEDVARTADIKALGSGYYQIPKKYLVELQRGYFDEDSNLRNDTFNIVFVSARSSDNLIDYNKYMEVTTDRVDNPAAVWVKPLYPSGDTMCNIQVTIYNVTRGTSTIVNFAMQIDGIKTTLTKSEYRTVVLAAFFGVFGVLFIIFMVRMGVYWRKKAEQRRIIKKNQTLIKMRDKMHNKTEAVSKEKLVHTKLKMEDPKYAKMFSEMRKEREAETGISLENSVVADKAERKAKAAKASKKKGKKSIADLQAELAAKREAVARMQMGDFSDMPDMAPAGDIPVVPVDGAPPGTEMPPFDQNAGFDGMTSEDLDAQLRAAMGDEILFDAPDDSNNDQG